LTLRDTFDLTIIVSGPREPIVRETLQAIRQRGAAPPTLLLLSNAADIDIVDTLNAGADDCIAEPVCERLLLARTHALLRRSQTTRARDPALTHFDGYRFDQPRGTVDVAGAPVTLTPKELMLALLLFRNLGRDLSREYLTDTVWARDSGPASRSLDTHISRIRSKLSLSPDNGYQLSSIYSHGYRLEQILTQGMPGASATRLVPPTTNGAMQSADPPPD
jgi:two-component system OmpR family response regulator